MSLVIKLRMKDEVAVMDCSGRITLGENTQTFREDIRDLLAKGQKKILINLREVSYIDNRGIDELVSGFTAVTNKGGQFKLFAPVKRVKDLLQITKLYNVFEVFPEDESAAIKSFH